MKTLQKQAGNKSGGAGMIDMLLEKGAKNKAERTHQVVDSKKRPD